MTRPTDPISRALADLYQRHAADTRGALAEYIPELARADPSRFGISLASLEGRIYHAGNADWAFTIQSISKPFVFALALTDLGLENVLARVGAEPSGEAFNAISLEEGTGRPANPMVNAGAILTTSLVKAADADERFSRIQAMLSAFAGRSLTIDEKVYASELEAGDKNRALAYLMKNAGALRADVDATLDVYFRQCALLVTTDDLAMMAATLANGGVQPITRERVVSELVASHVLTLMGSCGMYDYAGEWLLRVGLPAKSGVAGGVMAVKPSQFGIGLASPLLDARGNSVRAIEACGELATRFELHLLNQFDQVTPPIAREESGATRRSSQPRTEQEIEVLAAHGGAIRILGLQGDIGFAATERILHASEEFASAVPARRWLILDLHRVGQVHRSARALLEAMDADLRDRMVMTVLCDPDRRALVTGAQEFSSLDEALCWCEDDLLQRRAE